MLAQYMDACCCTDEQTTEVQSHSRTMCMPSSMSANTAVHKISAQIPCHHDAPREPGALPNRLANRNLRRLRVTSVVGSVYVHSINTDMTLSHRRVSAKYDTTMSPACHRPCALRPAVSPPSLLHTAQSPVPAPSLAPSITLHTTSTPPHTRTQLGHTQSVVTLCHCCCITWHPQRRRALLPCAQT
jgi:hypothetical protein